MSKGKKPPMARRWAQYLRTLGARGWGELTPEQRAAAYERCLRHWRNSQGVLPETQG
jgi:hypothetical protein